jgi:hypothetical protein
MPDGALRGTPSELFAPNRPSALTFTAHTTACSVDPADEMPADRTLSGEWRKLNWQALHGSGPASHARKPGAGTNGLAPTRFSTARLASAEQTHLRDRGARS